MVGLVVATNAIILDNSGILMPYLIPVAAAPADTAVVEAGPNAAAVLEKKKKTMFHQVNPTSAAPAAIPAAEVAEAGPNGRPVVAVGEEAEADPRMIVMQE